MPIPVLSDPFWRKALFDEAPVALVVSGSDGVVVDSNMAMAALVGYTVEEIEGGLFYSLFHTAEQAAIRHGVASLDVGDAFEICARIAHRSGHYHYTRLHIRRGEGRLVCHVILLVSDGSVTVSTPDGVADQILNVRPKLTLTELVLNNPGGAAAVGVALLIVIGRDKLVELIKLWLMN
jgi:PAS domain S-box-containing protein